MSAPTETVGALRKGLVMLCGYFDVAAGAPGALTGNGFSSTVSDGGAGVYGVTISDPLLELCSVQVTLASADVTVRGQVAATFGTTGGDVLVAADDGVSGIPAAADFTGRVYIQVVGRASGVPA